MPIIAATGMAATMRTAAIENADQFGAAVRRLHHRLADTGRDPRSVDIQVVCPPVDLDDGASVDHARGVLAELAGHGATWAVVHVDGTSQHAAVDYIKEFGNEMDLVADQSISESRL
ncbi:hypothetical protein [Mycolicibacterium porcinum]|uniref:Uncharacterized protein n=1 Tax=Mycolicibacterium porcinum TaxID=39693 RepID=A0ABV3VMT2_9MYCO